MHSLARFQRRPVRGPGRASRGCRSRPGSRGPGGSARRMRHRRRRRRQKRRRMEGKTVCMLAATAPSIEAWRCGLAGWLGRGDPCLCRQAQRNNRCELRLPACSLLSSADPCRDDSAVANRPAVRECSEQSSAPHCACPSAPRTDAPTVEQRSWTARQPRSPCLRPSAASLARFSTERTAEKTRPVILRRARLRGQS